MNRRRWLLCIAAGLLAMLAGTVATLPASLIASMAGERESFSLHGVHGSVWQGGIRQVLVAQGADLQDVDWHVSATQLLRGELRTDVRFRMDPLRGNIRLLATPNGTIRLKSGQLRGDAKALGQMIDVLPENLSGTLLARLDTAKIVDATITDIHADAVWLDARLDGLHPLDLGEVELTVQPNTPDHHTVHITGRNGALDIDGEINIDAQHTYELLLTLQPKQGLSTNAGPLRYLASMADTDGVIQYQGHGIVHGLSLD